MAGKKKQTELSSLVMFICMTVRKFAAAFFVLAVLGVLLLSPGEVEKGLYIFIIIANAALFGGTYLLEGFMRRSTKEFLEKTGARREQAGEASGIDQWLAKKDAEKDGKK